MEKSRNSNKEYGKKRHCVYQLTYLKNTTARMVRKEHGEAIKDFLWGDSFWSDSYYLGTTGGSTLDVIQKYIEDQGKPKRKYVKTKW